MILRALGSLDIYTTLQNFPFPPKGYVHGIFLMQGKATTMCFSSCCSLFNIAIAQRGQSQKCDRPTAQAYLCNEKTAPGHQELI